MGNYKPSIEQLEKSTKAIRSFKELLDNGPLMTIFAIQTLAIIILITLLLKGSNEKANIQKELYEKMIERIDNKMDERVNPVMENAEEAVNKMNSSREMLDSTSLKLKQLISTKKK